MRAASRRLGTLPVVAVACAVALSASSAFGQLSRVNPFDRSPMSPIDAGVADLTDLSTSFRFTGLDLAQPRAFDRAYAVPGRPGLQMRADGALHAIYDTAVYDTIISRRFRRTVAPIPGGTFFYIGGPDDIAVNALLPRTTMADRAREAGRALDGLIPGRYGRADAVVGPGHERDVALDDRARAAESASEGDEAAERPLPRVGFGTSVAPAEPARRIEDEPIPRFLRDAVYRRARLSAFGNPGDID